MKTIVNAPAAPCLAVAAGFSEVSERMRKRREKRDPDETIKRQAAECREYDFEIALRQRVGPVRRRDCE